MYGKMQMQCIFSSRLMWFRITGFTLEFICYQKIHLIVMLWFSSDSGRGLTLSLPSNLENDRARLIWTLSAFINSLVAASVLHLGTWTIPHSSSELISSEDKSSFSTSSSGIIVLSRIRRRLSFYNIIKTDVPFQQCTVIDPRVLQGEIIKLGEL